MTLEIERIFTSYENPKDNANTEVMMRTIKGEVISVSKFVRFEKAKEVMKSWIELN